MYIENKKSTIAGSGSINGPILINWVDATHNFDVYYNELVKCINENKIEQGPNGVKKIYIGQCPFKQLVNLVDKMQGELEKLIQDMDDPQATCNLSDNGKNQKKLADHTITLNRLNQQALTSLLLTTRTTS